MARTAAHFCKWSVTVSQHYLFFWPIKGQNSFLVHLAAGGQERGRRTGQMDLPIDQHLHNPVHLAAEPMLLPAQFADQRGNWRKEGNTVSEVLQEQRRLPALKWKKTGISGRYFVGMGCLQVLR